MKLYMFRTVPLSIISGLFTAVPSWSCLKAVYKPVWHIPLLSVQWINSWWRTEELSETCRVSCQNKFVKLVHLVGFITKKDCSVVFTQWHGITSKDGLQLQQHHSENLKSEHLFSWLAVQWIKVIKIAYYWLSHTNNALLYIVLV